MTHTSVHEITARIRATGEDLATTRQELQALTHATLQEPGCIHFSIHEDTSAPGHFLMWEVFENEQAFQAHFEYPHTLAYVEKNLSEVVEYWVSQPL